MRRCPGGHGEAADKGGKGFRRLVAECGLSLQESRRCPLPTGDAGTALHLSYVRTKPELGGCALGLLAPSSSAGGAAIGTPPEGRPFLLPCG